MIKTVHRRFHEDFVGAKGELEDCLLKMDQQKVIESLSLRRVKWILTRLAHPTLVARGKVW